MKRKGFEQYLMILLFILVLIVFSFAERDSRKLDRLYNTAQVLQKKTTTQTVQTPPPPAKATNN